MIPVAYIVYQMKFACLLNLPDMFSSLNALSWVQIEFFISFCPVVQYPRGYSGQASTRVFGYNTRDTIQKINVIRWGFSE